jgi:tetratricopeptide (TPR) repeat protein
MKANRQPAPGLLPKQRKGARSWLGIALGFGVVVVIAVWGGWRWFEEHNFRREFKQAESDFAGGRYRQARQRVSELVEKRPGSGEADYQLGLCEEKLGHSELALTAWSGVAPGSPLFIKASVGRAHLLKDSGRFTLAENALTARPTYRGQDALQVRQALELLYASKG